MCVLDFLFPKCQTHAYTRFENGCSENSTKKLLTKYTTEENNKHVICRPRSVRIGKNCALGLEYVPWTQDLWHSFSQYGPPGRQITYIYNIASTAAQSNSVYVSVLNIQIVHAHSVSKSIRQKFFFSRERPFLERGKILYFATIIDTNRDSAHQSQTMTILRPFLLG